MTVQQIIHQVVTDRELETMLAAVAIDLVLGILAAFKLGTFRLAYVSNFARNDVLGKVVPWAFLEASAVVAGGFDIVIPGVDLSVIAQTTGGIIIAALVGSILSSLRDLGFLGAGRLPAAAAGSGRDVAA